jgi:hypothetical protein
MRCRLFENTRVKLDPIFPAKQTSRVSPPGSSATLAIPFERWPAHYKALAKFAKPGDIGIGNVVERVIGPLGGTLFKIWYKQITGKSCGCGARKQMLNERYPLNRNVRSQELN